MMYLLYIQANKRYSKQLSLPETSICLYTEDGGILVANKAVAAYQVGIYI